MAQVVWTLTVLVARLGVVVDRTDDAFAVQQITGR